tara:strand:+ start:28969 stop:29751 length:783 start_codon:yes stop_codon:yes gene_type:complete
MKILVVSGGFDPIHSGHIALFKGAKKLGDCLVVALNSDEWLIKKKGKAFMSFHERKNIIENLSMVDRVIDFEDDNLGSASLALKKVKKLYPNDNIIFCNGGDRNDKNIQEKSVSGVDFIFGVGGKDKKNSSSWLINDYYNNSEKRTWGKFSTLFNDENIKVKELIVDPGKNLSYQRHKHRSEFWFVSKGCCKVNHAENESSKPSKTFLSKNQVFHIESNNLHQIVNESSSPCHIIEIQYGERTIENDIERITKCNINEQE